MDVRAVLSTRLQNDVLAHDDPVEVFQGEARLDVEHAVLANRYLLVRRRHVDIPETYFTEQSRQIRMLGQARA